MTDQQVTERAIFSGKMCPYCGEKTDLVDSKEIYGRRGYGLFYVCKPCDAHVGVHKGTTKALGRLANKELRSWKMRAHRAFDRIWRGGSMNRHQAYSMLAELLSIDPSRCHIGMFDIDLCKKTEEVCAQITNRLMKSR